MSKYIQRKDGEGWAEKSGRIFKLACCDCGLVHDVVLIAGRKGSKIGIAAKRNNLATAARRRGKPNASDQATASEELPL